MVSNKTLGLLQNVQLTGLPYKPNYFDKETNVISLV